MRGLFVVVTLMSTVAISSGAEAKGCISGAIAGGIAGHYVGKGHALSGALAGCVIGHHMANRNARQVAPGAMVPRDNNVVPVR